MGKTKKFEHGGSDVGKNAAGAKFTFVVINNEGNRVGAVGGERSSVLCKHNVCVAVVGGYKNRSAKFPDLFTNFAETFVNCLTGGYSGLKNAGVADHVGVCVVEDDNVVLVFVKFFKKLFGNEVCAEFRL